MGDDSLANQLAIETSKVVREHQGEIAEQGQRLDQHEKRMDSHEQKVEKGFKALHERIDEKADKSKAARWLRNTILAGLATGIATLIGGGIAWLAGFIKF